MQVTMAVIRLLLQELPGPTRVGFGLTLWLLFGPWFAAWIYRFVIHPLSLFEAWGYLSFAQVIQDWAAGVGIVAFIIGTTLAHTAFLEFVLSETTRAHNTAVAVVDRYNTAADALLSLRFSRRHQLHPDERVVAEAGPTTNCTLPTLPSHRRRRRARRRGAAAAAVVVVPVPPVTAAEHRDAPTLARQTRSTTNRFELLAGADDDSESGKSTPRDAAPMEHDDDREDDAIAAAAEMGDELPVAAADAPVFEEDLRPMAPLIPLVAVDNAMPPRLRIQHAEARRRVAAMRRRRLLMTVSIILACMVLAAVLYSDLNSPHSIIISLIEKLAQFVVGGKLGAWTFVLFASLDLLPDFGAMAAILGAVGLGGGDGGAPVAAAAPPPAAVGAAPVPPAAAAARVQPHPHVGIAPPAPGGLGAAHDVQRHRDHLPDDEVDMVMAVLPRDGGAAGPFGWVPRVAPQGAAAGADGAPPPPAAAAAAALDDGLFLPAAANDGFLLPAEQPPPPLAEADGLDGDLALAGLWDLMGLNSVSEILAHFSISAFFLFSLTAILVGVPLWAARSQFVLLRILEAGPVLPFYFSLSIVFWPGTHTPQSLVVQPEDVLSLIAGYGCFAVLLALVVFLDVILRAAYTLAVAVLRANSGALVRVAVRLNWYWPDARPATPSESPEEHSARALASLMPPDVSAAVWAGMPLDALLFGSTHKRAGWRPHLVVLSRILFMAALRFIVMPLATGVFLDFCVAPILSDSVEDRLAWASHFPLSFAASRLVLGITSQWLLNKLLIALRELLHYDLWARYTMPLAVSRNMHRRMLDAPLWKQLSGAFIIMSVTLSLLLVFVRLPLSFVAAAGRAGVITQPVLMPPSAPPHDVIAQWTRLPWQQQQLQQWDISNRLPWQQQQRHMHAWWRDHDENATGAAAAATAGGCGSSSLCTPAAAHRSDVEAATTAAAGVVVVDAWELANEAVTLLLPSSAVASTSPSSSSSSASSHPLPTLGSHEWGTITVLSVLCVPHPFAAASFPDNAATDTPTPPSPFFSSSSDESKSSRDDYWTSPSTYALPPVCPPGRILSLRLFVHGDRVPLARNFGLASSSLVRLRGEVHPFALKGSVWDNFAESTESDGEDVFTDLPRVEVSGAPPATSHPAEEASAGAPPLDGSSSGSSSSWGGVVGTHAAAALTLVWTYVRIAYAFVVAKAWAALWWMLSWDLYLWRLIWDWNSYLLKWLVFSIQQVGVALRLNHDLVMWAGDHAYAAAEWILRPVAKLEAAQYLSAHTIVAAQRIVRGFIVLNPFAYPISYWLLPIRQQQQYQRSITDQLNTTSDGVGGNATDVLGHGAATDDESAYPPNTVFYRPGSTEFNLSVFAGTPEFDVLAPAVWRAMAMQRVTSGGDSVLPQRVSWGDLELETAAAAGRVNVSSIPVDPSRNCSIPEGTLPAGIPPWLVVIARCSSSAIEHDEASPSSSSSWNTERNESGTDIVSNAASAAKSRRPIPQREQQQSEHEGDGRVAVEILLRQMPVLSFVSRSTRRFAFDDVRVAEVGDRLGSEGATSVPVIATLSDLAQDRASGHRDSSNTTLSDLDLGLSPINEAAISSSAIGSLTPTYEAASTSTSLSDISSDGASPLNNSAPPYHSTSMHGPSNSSTSDSGEAEIATATRPSSSTSGSGVDYILAAAAHPYLHMWRVLHVGDVHVSEVRVREMHPSSSGAAGPNVSATFTTTITAAAALPSMEQTLFNATAAVDTLGRVLYSPSAGSDGDSGTTDPYEFGVPLARHPETAHQLPHATPVPLPIIIVPRLQAKFVSTASVSHELWRHLPPWIAPQLDETSVWWVRPRDVVEALRRPAHEEHAEQRLPSGFFSSVDESRSTPRRKQQQRDVQSPTSVPVKDNIDGAALDDAAAPNRTAANHTAAAAPGGDAAGGGGGRDGVHTPAYRIGQVMHSGPHAGMQLCRRYNVSDPLKPGFHLEPSSALDAGHADSHASVSSPANASSATGRSPPAREKLVRRYIATWIEADGSVTDCGPTSAPAITVASWLPPPTAARLLHVPFPPAARVSVTSGLPQEFNDEWYPPILHPSSTLRPTLASILRDVALSNARGTWWAAKKSARIMGAWWFPGSAWYRHPLDLEVEHVDENDGARMLTKEAVSVNWRSGHRTRAKRAVLSDALAFLEAEAQRASENHGYDASTAAAGSAAAAATAATTAAVSFSSYRSAVVSVGLFNYTAAEIAEIAEIARSAIQRAGSASVSLLQQSVSLLLKSASIVPGARFAVTAVNEMVASNSSLGGAPAKVVAAAVSASHAVVARLHSALFSLTDSALAQSCLAILAAVSQYLARKLYSYPSAAQDAVGFVRRVVQFALRHVPDLLPSGGMRFAYWSLPWQLPLDAVILNFTALLALELVKSLGWYMKSSAIDPLLRLLRLDTTLLPPLETLRFTTIYDHGRVQPTRHALSTPSSPGLSSTPLLAPSQSPHSPLSSPPRSRRFDKGAADQQQQKQTPPLTSAASAAAHARRHRLHRRRKHASPSLSGLFTDYDATLLGGETTSTCDGGDPLVLYPRVAVLEASFYRQFDGIGGMKKTGLVPMYACDANGFVATSVPLARVLPPSWSILAESAVIDGHTIRTLRTGLDFMCAEDAASGGGGIYKRRQLVSEPRSQTAPSHVEVVTPLQGAQVAVAPADGGHVEVAPEEAERRFGRYHRVRERLHRSVAGELAGRRDIVDADDVILGQEFAHLNDRRWCDDDEEDEEDGAAGVGSDADDEARLPQHRHHHAGSVDTDLTLSRAADGGGEADADLSEEQQLLQQQRRGQLLLQRQWRGKQQGHNEEHVQRMRQPPQPQRDDEVTSPLPPITTNTTATSHAPQPQSTTAAATASHTPLPQHNTAAAAAPLVLPRHGHFAELDIAPVVPKPRLEDVQQQRPHAANNAPQQQQRVMSSSTELLNAVEARLMRDAAVLSTWAITEATVSDRVGGMRYLDGGDPLQRAVDEALVRFR